MSRKENYGPGFQGGPNGFWFESLKSPHKRKKERLEFLRLEMQRDKKARERKEFFEKCNEAQRQKDELELQYQKTLTTEELKNYLSRKQNDDAIKIIATIGGALLALSVVVYLVYRWYVVIQPSGIAIFLAACCGYWLVCKIVCLVTEW